MNLKEIVGKEAAKRVQDGDIVGLGTGSTTQHFIISLGQRIKAEELEVLGIPTSYQSFYLAQKAGIPLTSLDEHHINLAVDGADEVDPEFNLIKGGGAAHTKEKVVDGDARYLLIIVDDTKMVELLGQTPVPVEVLPLAYRPVTEALESMGGIPSLRMAIHKDGPIISDNGNFIVDVQFDEIIQPSSLEAEINNIPGVVENGLFCSMVDEVLVGTPEGLVNLRRD